MAGMELLERLRNSGLRERVEVYENEPPHQLVASEDILRLDQHARPICVCPAGQPPASWLELTAAERASLIDPPPRLPRGHMHPGPYGFTLEGVVSSGFTIEDGG